MKEQEINLSREEYINKIKHLVDGILDLRYYTNYYGIRFNTPIIGIVGINYKYQLCVTSSCRNGMALCDIDNVDDVHILSSIYKQLKDGNASVMIGHLILSSCKMLDFKTNNRLYTYSELVHKDEIFRRIVGVLLASNEIQKHMIKYCWFNAHEGEINSPIRFTHDMVEVFIDGGLKEYGDISNWFNSNKELLPYCHISKLNLVGKDKDNSYPGSVQFFYSDEVKKMVQEAFSKHPEFGELVKVDVEEYAERRLDIWF